MKKKLAILGASYLQVPLILKAKEMGLETHVFAWREGAVCEKYVDYFYPISVIEKKSILEKCKEVGVDGITTIATDLPMTSIGYVAENLSLVGNSYLSTQMSTNKQLMRDAFLKYNCRTPKVYAKNNLDAVEFPCIVKPVDRSGSRGINVVRSQKELSIAIEEALNHSIVKDYLIEEYIEGEELSVESISWNGEHQIIAITDKVTTGQPRFVELAHMQPSKLNKQAKQKIVSECVKCLDALQIKFGASHSEFKINEKGDIYIIEVGARMGGDFIGSHITSLSTGVDYLKAVIDVALNQFKWDNIELSEVVKHSGVIYLANETKDDFDFILNNYSEYIIQKDIFNRDFKNITNSNDRSGYLIYQSGDLNLYQHAVINSNNSL